MITYPVVLSDLALSNSAVTNAISLLDLYQTQYSQTDKLWGYFGTVTLAVLAFSLGSEKATKTIKESGLIIAGYFIFCIGNFMALSKAQEQLEEFAFYAIDASKKAGIPFNNLEPFNLNYITWFYWCVAVAVFIGIIVITWWRQS